MTKPETPQLEKIWKIQGDAAWHAEFSIVKWLLDQDILCQGTVESYVYSYHGIDEKELKRESRLLAEYDLFLKRGFNEIR